MSRYRENTQAMGMHIIVTGNPVDGLEFYGPFNNGAEAAKFGNTDPNMPDEWWIAPLQSVTEGQPLT